MNDYGNIEKHRESIMSDIVENRETKVIETPWINLNEKLNGGLYPGLYSIGAISALGKTAFCLQLADHVCKTVPVLYFSIEMSRTELVARSISRNVFEAAIGDFESMQRNKKFSTISALHGFNENFHFFEHHFKQHLKKHKNMNIIEGGFNTSVQTIVDTINSFINDFKIKPVVIIDYLQIISHGKKNRHGDDVYLSDKQAIDEVTKVLKQTSRDTRTCMIVISSFNRQNYNEKVSYESFKESGIIEYTSDVLLGLQLSALSEKTENKEKRQELIQEAKNKEVKEISLMILKQRNGKSNLKQEFNFHAKNNFFEERKKIEKG
jgi:replicative DNA helicase